MSLRNSIQIAAVVLTTFVWTGCSERDNSTLPPVTAPSDAEVFVDDFAEGVDFQAFQGSNLNALGTDDNVKHQGTSSLKVFVPDQGDPNGEWAGGAFVTNTARDLTGYNALTFWAKSSAPTTLNVAGLGNDNTGTSKYAAELHDIPLTTEWTKIIIPIPLSAKLALEKGLFFFAEAPEGTSGHQIWFDDVIFETVAAISNPRPTMTSQALNAFVGTTINPTGTQVTFSVDGADKVIQHLPGYLTFLSSNESVVAVNGGNIQVVGGGAATITAKLGETPATGELTVNATAPPATPAPAPTFPAGNVISLFSNSYINVPVDRWSTDWDITALTDLQVAGNDLKAYTDLVYAGIEFTTQTIDATEMTHFHMNIWVPEGSVFKVKLVDFGTDGTYGGAPDSEHELSFTSSSTPALVPGSWVGLDVPLTAFTGLASRAHMAQLIISGDVGTVFVDNVLFHK